MTKFIPHTQEELEEFGIKENQTYKIEYFNKDYFNGEATLEIATATAIINNGKITFLVPDPYGMDKFIDNVRIIKH
jgi:hypothetical protein